MSWDWATRRSRESLACPGTRWRRGCTVAAVGCAPGSLPATGGRPAITAGDGRTQLRVSSVDERQQPARVWAPVGALAERQGVPPSVRHACIACADAVAAVGASLSLAYGDGPCEPVFASDPGTSELQGLQFRLGEGPGVDALSSGRTVLAVDLSSACSPRRWPGFAPAAVQRGVRAVFAFPVRGGPIRSGVLEMYRLLTGPLSRRQLAMPCRAPTSCWRWTTRAGWLAGHSPEPPGRRRVVAQVQDGDLDESCRPEALASTGADRGPVAKARFAGCSTAGWPPIGLQPR